MPYGTMVVSNTPQPFDNPYTWVPLSPGHPFCAKYPDHRLSQPQRPGPF